MGSDRQLDNYRQFDNHRQLHNYQLHGVNIKIRCSPTVAEKFDARFRLLPREEGLADSIHFEFDSVSNSSLHTVGKPSAIGRPFYEIPYGEAYSFENGDQLYVSFGPGIRALCEPGAARARISIVESELGALFFGSHLLFTIFLMEMLKRRGWHNLHAAGFSDNGRAALIAGTSGAGKSTLSIALLRGGFDYLTDDMIFLKRLHRGLGAFGLPEDVDVTANTIRFFPELDFLLTTKKDAGFPKWQVQAADVYGATVARHAIPAAIFFPHIAGTSKSIVEPIAADEALFLMASNVLLTHPDSCQEHLDTLTDLAQRTPCYRLETGRDFDRIPDLFREVLSGRLVESNA